MKREPCNGMWEECPYGPCNISGMCLEDDWLREEDREAEEWPSRTEDERMDDPRHGQASGINRRIE